MGDEACEHHEAQVGVRMTEVEIEDVEECEIWCDWCGDSPDLLLEKSQRHRLILCEECRDIIRVLAGGD